MQILHNQQSIPNYLGYFGLKHCYQLAFLASKSSCDRVVQKNCPSKEYCRKPKYIYKQSSKTKGLHNAFEKKNTLYRYFMQLKTEEA